MNRRIARNVLGGGAIAAAFVLAGCTWTPPVEPPKPVSSTATLESEGPLVPATPSTETTVVAEASNPLPSEAELLRIFIGESDKHRGRALYEVLVEEARRWGLTGATVLRGTLGFGATRRCMILLWRCLPLCRQGPWSPSRP